MRKRPENGGYFKVVFWDHILLIFYNGMWLHCWSRTGTGESHRAPAHGVTTSTVLQENEDSPCTSKQTEERSAPSKNRADPNLLAKNSSCSQGGGGVGCRGAYWGNLFSSHIDTEGQFCCSACSFNHLPPTAVRLLAPHCSHPPAWLVTAGDT